MKILFLSESPINKQVSIGNTFLDVFKDFEDAELYSFYIRNGMPDVSRITSAYRISDKRLIKHCLSPSKMGEYIDCAKIKDSTAAYNDNRFEKYVKKNRPSFFFLIRTTLWKILPWRKSGLKQFIDEVQPDIIFTLLTNEIILNDIILYVSKISTAKLVVYAWDDTYGLAAHSKNIFTTSVQKIRRKLMRKVVASADKMYVISDMQKKEYEKDFNKKLDILTKSSHFELGTEPVLSFNTPLKLLYTGNLSLGRLESISLIFDALKKYNVDGKKAVMDIYSSSVLSDNQINMISDNDNSFFHGETSNEHVELLQKNADVLVFAEGFDEHDKKLVRLSFSTKLVDYFRTAKPIFAIGPKEVSSINYLDENDAAVICSDVNEVYDRLKQLLDNKDFMTEYALKGYNCGKRNHSSFDMTDMLENDLSDLIKKEGN